jgi:hypothetical protein
LHADWRSGATSAGSRRGDDEDKCRSHGRKVVTRWSSIRYAQCTVRWGRSIELNHCTAQSTQKIWKKLKQSKYDMQYYAQYLSNKLEWKNPSWSDGKAGVGSAKTVPDFQMRKN